MVAWTLGLYHKRQHFHRNYRILVVLVQKFIRFHGTAQNWNDEKRKRFNGFSCFDNFNFCLKFPKTIWILRSEKQWDIEHNWNFQLFSKFQLQSKFAAVMRQKWPNICSTPPFPHHSMQHFEPRPFVSKVHNGWTKKYRNRRGKQLKLKSNNWTVVSHQWTKVVQ